MLVDNNTFNLPMLTLSIISQVNLICQQPNVNTQLSVFLFQLLDILGLQKLLTALNHSEPKNTNVRMTICLNWNQPAEVYKKKT